MSTKYYVAFVGRYADEQYAPETDAGYSCQTWLARLLNELLHRGKYFCWFSKNFNAFENGDDSNPALIYLQIDRAVKQSATNNAKIKDVRANLMRAAIRELTDAGRTVDISDVVRVLYDAPLSWFRPEVWRLRVSAIEGRYSADHQYPDEFKIENLQTDEYDIVIK